MSPGLKSKPSERVCRFLAFDMKMSRLAVLGIAVAMLVLSTPLRAVQILTGDSAFGANTLTIDTSSGLAWLNVTLTAGMSYNQVLAATLPGGEFQGFRYATAPEVLALYNDAGIPGRGIYPVSTPAAQSIRSLVSLVGVTFTQYGNPGAIGITGTVDSAGVELSSALYCTMENGTTGYLVTGVPSDATGYGVTYGTPTVGSWLVYSVPEPASCCIVALSGLSLLLFRRRK
jgi:hypothetical protein